ncbi:MAG TPA: dihydroorotate dehydrogenase [Anaerolineaceae bacterium]|nr:dihydroorotate dehydrogenase [Anaerolineaceae bacterium]
MRTQFLGMALANPLVLASGVLGTSASLMERVAREGAGAVTSKSAGPEPRAGHPNPVALAWQGGVLNAIGLTNPGAREEVGVLREAGRRLRAMDVPLFASIFAPRVEDFAETAKTIAEAEPDLIEINISCPNVASEFGTPFSASEESAAEVTRAVRQAVSLPLSVKLAPNVPQIGRIARAVVLEGADAITAINTMPAMLIDAQAGKPVLSNLTGGLSGPALKPIALRCVWEIARSVSVPIIGTGGVSSGEDAAEMLMAGATLVGVGSAVWQHGPAVFGRIATELRDFMAREGYPDLASLLGKAC